MYLKNVLLLRQYFYKFITYSWLVLMFKSIAAFYNFFFGSSNFCIDPPPMVCK